MQGDLASGPVGSSGNYDVAFKNGQLVASVAAQLPPGESVSLVVSLDSDKVLDAIAAAIPGNIDNAIISVIKLALKA